MIQIVETADFGKLIILNEMANLAEIDREEYTHALMNMPHEDFHVSTFFTFNFLKNANWQHFSVVILSQCTHKSLGLLLFT